MVQQWNTASGAGDPGRCAAARCERGSGAAGRLVWCSNGTLHLELEMLVAVLRLDANGGVVLQVVWWSYKSLQVAWKRPWLDENGALMPLREDVLAMGDVRILSCS